MSATRPKRKMWDFLLSGRMSPIEVSRWADAHGLRTRKTAQLSGKPLTFQDGYRLFSNSFYMGLIQLKCCENYKGGHEPMVTRRSSKMPQFYSAVRDGHTASGMPSPTQVSSSAACAARPSCLKST